jgi:raffinose/stachyose/melibiose transport system permease protein
MPVVTKSARHSPSVSIWFVVPAILILVTFVVIPAIAGVALSFTDYKGYGAFQWTGIDNYVRLFGDNQAISAIGNTVVLAVTVVIGQNLLGLVLALALEAPLRGRRVLQVLFLMPVIISPVIISYLWQYIFAPDGALNVVLRAIGLGEVAQPWLGQPTTALWAIAVVVIWQYTGNAMVIYLAGLLNVPIELSEASSLDGANLWQRITRIKLPLMVPAITINVVLTTITGLRLFDQILAMTNGGPGYATDTIATVIYKRGFSGGEFGYALAMAIVLTIGIASLTVIQTIVLRRRESA